MKNRTLIDYIESDTEKIRPLFEITDERWASLMGRLTAQLSKQRADYYDEEVWTFLLCLAFAANGKSGILELEKELSGFPIDSNSSSQLWLEALPIPPRKSEGNTNVDLALGAITKRPGKEGGIQYNPDCGGSITFCEMKWYSDISKSVSNDQHRNQLSRVIENACTLQQDGQCPSQITVALVTPEIFVGTNPKSRLYHYKLEEYIRCPETLLNEWGQSYQRMPKREEREWHYPDAEELKARVLNQLQLRHVSYEHLFSAAPASGMTPHIQNFISSFNSSAQKFGLSA